MALLNASWPTLVDVTKRLDPDGRPAKIAEIMEKVNPFLEDMPMLEGNLPTGHQGTIRAGYPTPAWRILNYGTLPTKTSTIQVTDTCGIIEDWSAIDEEIYKLNGASDAFRMSEDRGKIQAMAQEFARGVLYGNTEVNPEQILGLTFRFNSLSAVNGGQIVNGQDLYGTGGSDGDCASMWLISWGPDTVHGIYPKGSQAGLLYENMGRMTLQNTPGTNDGRLMNAMVSHFIQKCGLHIRDWQGIVRIGGIDWAELKVDTTAARTTSPSLIDLMIDAQSRIPQRLDNVGRKVWYCPSPMFYQLQRLAMEKTVSQLTATQLENGPIITRFWGIPIKRCDSLTLTESRVGA